MKQGWVYKKLGDVAEISAGQGAPQGEQNYCSNGTPFIKAGNLEDLVNGIDENSVQKVSQEVAQKHKLKLYKAGSVLFAKSGMSCMKGYVYTLKKDCYVVSHLAIIYPKSVNSNFLNYYLRQAKTYSLVKDAAYPSISLSDIALFPVPVPPVEKQKEICSLLDKLNRVIEAKKEQLKELDNLAQSLFYEMFGDPENNNKGWKTLALGDACTLKAGKSIKASELSETINGNLFPCYGGNGIRGYIDKFSHNIPLPIIGRQGALCGNVNFAKAPFYATEHAVVVTPKTTIEVVWLYYVLKLMHLNQYAHGVAQPGLSVQDIEPLPLIIPPHPLQQAFAEKVKAIERQKELINQSIKDVQTLFDAKMDYYFGE